MSTTLRRRAAGDVGGITNIPISRIEAQDLAWVFYATQAPAVVELIILASSGDRVERFKALRALEWFEKSPAYTAELPARPTHLEAPKVAEAMDSLSWVLYGWERGARIRAAQHAGDIIEQLAEGTSS